MEIDFEILTLNAVCVWTLKVTGPDTFCYMALYNIYVHAAVQVTSDQ